VPPIGPETPVSLPSVGGPAMSLGGSGTPQLTFFFGYWNTQTFPLRDQLAALGRYASLAKSARLPRAVAVDEASVEPAPGQAPQLVRSLHPAASLPVAIDRSGRVGDGYEVQDQPWLVLTSGTGQILWHYDASTDGALTTADLVRHVRAALRAAPRYPGAGSAASAALAGSPQALAGLHSQAGQLLGPETALVARLTSLRGYPVVLNAWASWCGPCRSEFSLFASSSVRFGRQVAFLGVDTSDASGDAQTFLASHPVSYPSYQAASTDQFQGLLSQGLAGLPTTIFIDRSGKITFVHTGQYDAQGSLDTDIRQYALGG
jgi:thiol-disulfide isomerase/thioredoxin